MAEIYFLGLVAEKLNNSYRVQINKNNRHSLPVGELVDRIIETYDQLEIGMTYYFYKAILNEVDKSVSTPFYTLIGNINTSNPSINSNISEELVEKIINLDIFPKDLV